MAERPSTADSHIFISYRRDDSIAHVNGLFLLLREHFGKHRIFKDTDNIPPGKDFRKVIDTQLKSCSVLLAVIGKSWLTLQKPKTNLRRLDDPNDYLRIEVSKALQDEGVLVIPLLVGQASMPSAEDLPSDLAQLSYLNAFELRDSRWESDIRLLIEAIESADLQPRAAPDPSVLSLYDSADTPLVPEVTPATAAATDDGVDVLELRRKRQIAEHMKTARAAFVALDYDVAVEACERALWLDGQNADARDLRKRARSALDEQKIAAWLTEAQEMMTRPDIEDAQLTVASGLVDQALALKPAHALAVQRRQELLAIRKQRTRQREIDRQMRATVARALVSFEEEDFDAALGYCDDALLLESDSTAARDLRAKVIAAKSELHRQRDLKRRARQAEQAEGAVLAAAAAERLRAEAKALEQKNDAEQRSLAEAKARAEKAATEEQRRVEARAREQAIAADRLAAATAPAIEHAIVPEPVASSVARTVPPSAPPRSEPALPSARRARLTPAQMAAAAIVLIVVVAGLLWNQSRSARSGSALPSSTVAPSIANQSAGSGSSTTPPPPAQKVEAPPSVVAPGADASAPTGEPAKAVPPPARETPATEAAVTEELAVVRQRAQAAYKAGQGSQALEASMAGLKRDPKDPDLLRTLTALGTDAESTLKKAKQSAASARAASYAVAEWNQAAQKEAEAAGLRKNNRPDEAIRALWAAADSYVKASDRARQVGLQLNGIATRARSELESGQHTQALDTLLEGLRLDPAFAPLHNVFATLWRDAQDAIDASKENFSQRGRAVAPPPEYQEGLRKESDAMKLRAAKDLGGAVKSLWAASELFEKAAERAAAAREAAKPAPTSPPAGAQASAASPLLAEILISGSPIADLPRNIGAGKGSIDHRSEVARGGPVSAVLWTSGCQKDAAGNCNVHADLVVYAPDGSVFHEAKNLDVSQGGAAVPLKVDAGAPTGVYRVVAFVRDLTSRRFMKLERQFGVR
jgi:tetratricopeptide (TPR) repeat protein